MWALLVQQGQAALTGFMAGATFSSQLMKGYILARLVSMWEQA
jgi:hypothetical protein